MSKKNYGKQFTTVTTHKNVQNYYNEKCAKYLMFDLKNTEELSFMTLKSDAKFEEKLTCGLENDLRNLANCYQSAWKSQNWDFDGILLSKVQNAWA